jgi:hypothetical protein
MPSTPMPSTVSGLTAWLESLAYEVAPELSAWPFYVIPASLRDALGQTSGTIDLAHRDRIRPWRGRGPAVVIDCRQIRQSTREPIPFAMPPADRWRFDVLDTFCHELTHVLERDEPFEPTTATPREVRAEIKQIDERIAAMAHPVDHCPAVLIQHPLQFHRLACHVAHRMRRVVPLVANPAGGRGYGFSSSFRYAEALGNEPQMMEQASFAEIRGTKPPAAFVDLWRQDVAAWLERIPAPTPFQRFAAEEALKENTLQPMQELQAANITPSQKEP